MHMRIEAITKRKIVVELSADDLDSLDITYDALDYASVETRRVIWVILDRVRESTGCDIDPSGQLLIDAMPRPAGGCILFFTIRGGSTEPFGMCGLPERVLRKQEQLVAAFEFDEINALLDCAAVYRRTQRNDCLTSCCELFSHVSPGESNRYRLLVCPAQELSIVKRFFQEYAQFCGEDTFAVEHTREHWKKHAEGQILALLGGTTEEPVAKQNSVTFAPGNVYTSL